MDHYDETNPQQPGKMGNQPAKNSSQQPQTIKELRQWYLDRHLPPEEVTRFFIGKDIREPKAFGIYKNPQGEFIVYKNKANGERAIRYQGTYEAYAVAELLAKLKEEISKRKGSKAPVASNVDSARLGSLNKASAAPDRYSGAGLPSPKKNKSKKGCFIVTIIGAIFAYFVAMYNEYVPNGYYQYEEKTYYHLGTSWFLYNILTNEWVPTGALDEWITHDNYNEFAITDFEGNRFEDTEWYEEYHSSSSSSSGSDSDYDWDDSGDSWDSNDTDWDDDW